MHRSIHPVLFLAIAAAACGGGGSPTGSPAGEAPSGVRTQVDRAEIALATLGETVTITATAGTQTTAAPSLSLAGERRWLDDRPVLDAAALGAGRVQAAAPGMAVLRVSAFGAAPVEVTVRVTPGRPLVMAASESDGTVALRGYRMDALRAAAIRIGGAAATVTGGGDSATLRVTLPVQSAGACTSGATRAVAIDGADVVVGVGVARNAAGELRLEVGAPVRLTAEQARCLRFAPIAGAGYALAFLDTRQLARAATGFEGMAPSSATWTASIAEAGQGAPAFSRGPAPSRVSMTDRVIRTSASPSSASPTLRATPWAAGDRFEVRDASSGAPLPVRVVRVYGGHLVFAVAEGEEAAGGTDAWIAHADSAFELLVQHGYPVLDAALAPVRPVTSAGSGQLLVIARRETSAYLGVNVSTLAGGRRVSYVYLNSAYPYTAAGLLRAAGHEVAHAWQEEWAARQGMAGGTGAAAWALEGTADLLGWTMLRRAMGVQLLSNFDWAAGMGDPSQASYALLPAATRGDVTAGYASAAAFLLDLTARMVSAGSTEDAALAGTVRGALEGWHGYDAFGGSHAGLTSRMRASLGGAWAPDEALLRWTLSQAVDDLTSARELQNPLFARVSTAGRERSAGWLAPAVLRSGASATREDPSAPATVQGNTATIAWRYGSPNYVRIEDEGFGGAYVLGATAGGQSLSDAAWMIVRYR